jgi:hypothetical protein
MAFVTCWMCTGFDDEVSLSTVDALIAASY